VLDGTLTQASSDALADVHSAYLRYFRSGNG
jgi:hypothetical protein